jgi:hypothetical protein
MSSQSAAAEKIGELLTREGLLNHEQLARSIEAQNQQYPSVPLGKVCVTLGFVSSADLAGVLVKHRRQIHLGELLTHLGLLSPSNYTKSWKNKKPENPEKSSVLYCLRKGSLMSLLSFALCTNSPS